MKTEGKLRIGLVSYECRNRDVAFNLSQIERALEETAGQVDLLCFGEAFLQGFDSLSWDYETDKDMAVGRDSETMRRLMDRTLQYGTALLLGYIERDGESLYSSCIVLSEGRIVHNYRRISRGWKEYSITDGHYREGTEVRTFHLFGREMQIVLCGDLWEFPERFRTDILLIWPVYVNYSPEEWEESALQEYADLAGQTAPEVLMINPLDRDPECFGGSCHFLHGKVRERTAYGREEILITEVR